MSICCAACAENNKQGMGGLPWFQVDNMKLPDWGSFADELEYSERHSSCYYHFCGQMPQSSPRSRLTNATFDCHRDGEDDFKLTELENVLLPMKEGLVNSCITYAKHIQALANYSVDIRSGLSKMLSNQAELQQQLNCHVQTTFPSVIRVMSLAYLWLADSFDTDPRANAQLKTSTLYPHATGRSLICIDNSCCVVHTVNSNCTRLTDSSRGCLIIAKAHKMLDVSMKFLVRTLYYVVHSTHGEEWFDSSLGHSRVLYTKKADARKLIRNHVKLNDKDQMSLAAFDAADAEGLRAKDAARALQVQTAGRSAGAASGGRDAGGTDDKGTSPDYSGLEAMPSNPAAPAPAAPAPVAAGAGAGAAGAGAAGAAGAGAGAAGAGAAGAAGAGAGAAAAAGAGAAQAAAPVPAPAAPAPAQAEASQQGAGGPPGQGPAPGPGQAGRPQRGQADWAAANEPREAPTERHADFAAWVKQLATAVFSAFPRLPKAGKLCQVPCACARPGGMGTCHV